MVANHLSRLEYPKREKLEEWVINDEFPKERLYGLQVSVRSGDDKPWFAYFTNFLIGGILQKGIFLSTK